MSAERAQERAGCAEVAATGGGAAVTNGRTGGRADGGGGGLGDCGSLRRSRGRPWSRWRDSAAGGAAFGPGGPLRRDEPDPATA